MKTKDLEVAIYKWVRRYYGLSCLEVTMPEGDRVDMLTYRKRNNTFECYEFKVSKSDLHSKCALTFVGDKNYICVPDILVEDAFRTVPEYVGVVSVSDDLYCSVKRKAKRIEPKSHSILMFCLMRSLQYRYDSNELFIRRVHDLPTDADSKE